MNILPLPPDTYYDLSRANELVSAVAPARQPREPAGEREAASRSTGTQVLDVVQREVLMKQYADTRRDRAAQFQARSGQQAVDAYGSVAQQDKRDVLEELLGISEYA